MDRKDKTSSKVNDSIRNKLNSKIEKQDQQEKSSLKVLCLRFVLFNDFWCQADFFRHLLWEMWRHSTWLSSPSSKDFYITPTWLQTSCKEQSCTSIVSMNTLPSAFLPFLRLWFQQRCTSDSGSKDLGKKRDSIYGVFSKRNLYHFMTTYPADHLANVL